MNDNLLTSGAEFRQLTRRIGGHGHHCRVGITNDGTNFFAIVNKGKRCDKNAMHIFHTGCTLLKIYGIFKTNKRKEQDCEEFCVELLAY